MSSIMEWLTKHVMPASWLERKAANAEELRLNREAIDRANNAVDTWNERTRANWRADGARLG